MLCTLCLKEKNRTIELVCGHNICYQCLPPQKAERFVYQCQTCLSQTQIDCSQKFNQKKNTKKLTKTSSQFFYPNSSNSKIKSKKQNQYDTLEGSFTSNHFSNQIYCWNCMQCFQVKQYLQSNHERHNAQILQEAMPALKNKYLQPYQKSLILIQCISQRKDNFQNKLSEQKQKYWQNYEKIQTFFAIQHQILDKKESEIKMKLDIQLNSVEKIVHKFMLDLQNIQNSIKIIGDNVEKFLKNKLTITDLKSLRQTEKILGNFTEYLRSSKYERLSQNTPLFIQKGDISQFFDSLYTLTNKTYQEQVQDPNTFQQCSSQKEKYNSSKINIKGSLQTLMNQESTKSSFYRKTIDQGFQNFQQKTQSYQRKVKLVEKLQNKILNTNKDLCQFIF